MTTDHELLSAIAAEIRKEGLFRLKVQGPNSHDEKLIKWADRIQSLLGGGWQDISTAPKDGTWVAAKRMGKRPFSVRYIYDSWQDENNLLRDPTHFYPLPATLKPTGEL